MRRFVEQGYYRSTEPTDTPHLQSTCAAMSAHPDHTQPAHTGTPPEVSAVAQIQRGSKEARSQIDFAALLRDVGYAATHSFQTVKGLATCLLDMRKPDSRAFAAGEIARVLLLFASARQGLTQNGTDVLAAILTDKVIKDIRAHADVAGWNTQVFASFVKTTVKYPTHILSY